MARRNLGIYFVIQFVIGFGFIGGFFTRLGFKPDQIVIEYFMTIVLNLLITKDVIPNIEFSPYFNILGPLLTLGSVFGSWKAGGILGVIGVFCAFVGGFYIGENISLVLLLFGIALGLIAPNIKS